MLVYEKLTPEDEDAIVDFYETYLNDGPSIREHIHEGMKDPLYIGVKCIDTDVGRIVGAVTVGHGLEFTVPHPELEEMVEKRWGKEGIYNGDLMVVEPPYRKLGVAQHMAAMVRQGLIDNHAVALVMELWKRADNGEVPAMHTIQGAWKDQEIMTLAVVENFYPNLADYGLTCPVCGTDCKCGAVIAAIEFKENIK